MSCLSSQEEIQFDKMEAKSNIQGQETCLGISNSYAHLQTHHLKKANQCCLKESKLSGWRWLFISIGVHTKLWFENKCFFFNPQTDDQTNLTAGDKLYEFTRPEQFHFTCDTCLSLIQESGVFGNIWSESHSYACGHWTSFMMNSISKENNAVDVWHNRVKTHTDRKQRPR